MVRKLNQSTSESASGIRLAPKANQRKSLFSPLGRNNKITAEIVGMNRIRRRRLSVMKFIMYSLCQQEEIKHYADNNESRQCKHQVLLDAPGLDRPDNF